jgi:uncharacterized protein (DUF1800 family)
MIRSMRCSCQLAVLFCCVSTLSLFAPKVAQAFEPPKAKTLVGPELTDREKVIQVLNRLSFGPRPGEVDAVLNNGGWQNWIKEQMDPSKIDDSAADKDITRRFRWSGKANIMEFKKACPQTQEKNPKANLEGELPEYVLIRAVESKRQFNEVMVEFWRNHFCVDMPDKEKSRSWTAGHYEEQVIRKNVFGKFKTMLYASATHPAMLEYLDNQLSHVNSWNENYAREVMELHTVGADVNYGNDDVRELSKALTGWQYNESYQFVFNAKEHQPGPKYWLSMTLPEGQGGGEMALKALCESQECANFISLKLCRHLVNDNPSPALIKSVAAVFKKTDGDLPKVYDAIINSPDFMSRENFRCKFKTPFDFTVSALRATNATVDNAHDVVHVIGKMGQPIYNCPDPTGYRFVAESWMDSGVLTSRWDFAWNLVRDQVNGVDVPEALLAKYKSLDSQKMEAAMAQDFVGGDIGDVEKKMDVTEAPRMLSILLGSPSFQQQ